MTTIVHASIPAAQFALEETFQSVPGAEFELVQLVADRGNRTRPLLTGTADEPERLPDAIRDDPSTGDVEVLAGVGEEVLVRLDWSTATRVFLHVIVEGDGTILAGSGADGRWRFRVLFPDRQDVSATFERCREYGIDIELERVAGVDESFRQGGFGLTDSQYETITRAYDGGYYSVPRGKNLQELAEELGVSHQALSERLRRGHGTLVENGLQHASEPVV